MYDAVADLSVAVESVSPEGVERETPGILEAPPKSPISGPGTLTPARGNALDPRAPILFASSTKNEFGGSVYPASERLSG